MPPGAHPRLWGMGGARTTYLQTQVAANSLKWQRVNVPASTYTSSWANELWGIVLKYKASPTSGNRTDVISACDTFIANRDTSPEMGANVFGIDADGTGQNYRFSMRTAAWFYDVMSDAQLATDGTNNDGTGTLRKTKLKDIMLTATSMLFDPAGTNGGPPNNTGGGGGKWETFDPLSNHHAQQYLGATYAGIALYGESLTYHWPPVSGTAYTFAIPFNWGTASGVGRDLTTYGDLYQWVIDRLKNVLLPEWDIAWAGGSHPEGSNYGMSCVHSFSEAVSILDQTDPLGLILGLENGPSIMESRSYFKDSVSRILYDMQPSRLTKFECGDYPRSQVGGLDGADIISALINIDGNRGTTEAAKGQYWLNTDWPDPNNAFLGQSQLKPYYFLLWNDTEPVYNYRADGEVKHYFDSGASATFSRSDWSTSGVFVGHNCGKKWKEHQHADCNHITITSGVGPEPIVRSAHYNNPPIASNIYVWHSHGHNTYTLYAGGSFPYSKGWVPGPSHRYNTPTGLASPFASPSIPLKCATGEYVYSQGLADWAFCTYKLGGIGEGHCTENDVSSAYTKARLTDYYTRELVHCLPGFVITFDRIKAASSIISPSTWAQARWHYGVAPTVAGTPSVTTINHGSARAFRQSILVTPGAVSGVANQSAFGAAPAGSPSSGSQVVNYYNVQSGGYDAWTQSNSYREEISIPLNSANGGYGRYCNVFEVTTTAQADMTPMSATPVAGAQFSNGATWTMAGVSIFGATLPPAAKHFLFSEEQDAATPTIKGRAIDYMVLKVSAFDVHRVFNLVPGQSYIVTETQLKTTGGALTGYYWYHLEPSQYGALANDAGVVEFRPPVEVFPRAPERRRDRTNQ